MCKSRQTGYSVFDIFVTKIATINLDLRIYEGNMFGVIYCRITARNFTVCAVGAADCRAVIVQSLKASTLLDVFITRAFMTSEAGEASDKSIHFSPHMMFASFYDATKNFDISQNVFLYDRLRMFHGYVVDGAKSSVINERLK